MDLLTRNGRSQREWVPWSHYLHSLHRSCAPDQRLHSYSVVSGYRGLTTYIPSTGPVHLIKGSIAGSFRESRHAKKRSFEHSMSATAAKILKTEQGMDSEVRRLGVQRCQDTLDTCTIRTPYIIRTPCIIIIISKTLVICNANTHSAVLVFRSVRFGGMFLAVTVICMCPFLSTQHCMGFSGPCMHRPTTCSDTISYSI